MGQETNQQDRFLYGLPFWNWFIYRFVWVAFAIGRMTIFRSHSTGRQSLPSKEPYLLLANHTSSLDSLWLSEQLYRPVRPMGSAQMLKVPVLGAFLKALGCFPKMKYTKDRGSMQMMQSLYDKGFVILIFPEGSRTLSGETQPILPGIGRLIKRMNPRVVYAVSHSSYLFRPRWARYPRLVPVEMHFDGPHHYDEDMSVEEINAEVQARLTSRPHISNSRRFLWGWRMAHGLPKCLWACPACLHDEGLTVDRRDGNAVQCTECGARWTIDVQCRLSGATETTVSDAMSDIHDRLGQPPVMRRADFEQNGVALRSAQMQLRLWPRGGKPEVQLEGEATLGASGFHIRSDDGQFHAGMDTMGAFSVEIGDRLFFRSEGRLYELCPASSSVYKWQYFLRKWKLAVAGTEY